MRKNKTYEQQKKYYDEYNEYEIMEDLFHLCDKKQFYQFVRIFNFGKK